MLRHGIKRFFSMVQSSIGLFALSLFCLTAAFVVLFIAHGFAAFKLQQKTQTKSAFTLAFAGQNPQELLAAYHEIRQDADLPALRVVCLANESVGGFESVPSASDTGVYLSYGRPFTMDEIVQGQRVVLVSDYYLTSFPPVQREAIWDKGIQLEGTPHQVVGLYIFSAPNSQYIDIRATYSPQIAPVMIPLKAFLTDGYQPTLCHYAFSQPLSKEQADRLKTVFSGYPSIRILSLPFSSSTAAILSYLSFLSPYAWAGVLALLNVVTILFRWHRQEFRRYRIYYLLGATKGQIRLLLCTNALLLSALSFVLAALAIDLLIRFSPSLFSPLPVSVMAAIWGIATMIYLPVLLIRANQQVQLAQIR